MNWWMLDLPFSTTVNATVYTLTLTTGYILLLMSGIWISRMLKHNLMEDVFNTANESFMQETRLMENEYSVNLPTKFVYQGKEWDGWINIVNPFRASIVLGTPGSGKSYAVVNNYIKQQIEKSFAMYIYDYKFPDLSEIAYNHLLKHRQHYKVKPEFYVINFDDPRRSHRCNPINPRFMADISDAYESAYTIMLNLNKTWIQKQGDFSWSHRLSCLPQSSGICGFTRTASIARSLMQSNFLTSRMPISSRFLPLIRPSKTIFPPLWTHGKAELKTSSRAR